MKNSIIILVISLLTMTNTFGQIPVTDAAASTALTANNLLATQNVAKNAGILVKAGATLETLSNMKKQYDQWEEDITEVTNYLEYGQQIMNIGNMLDQVKVTYSRSLTLLDNSNYLTQSDRKRVVYAFYRLLTEGIKITSESVDIVTSGTYKMTDSERLLLLKKSEFDLKENLRLMQYMVKKVEYSEARARQNERNNALFAKNTETFKN